MRKSRVETAATRHRIVEAAAAEFRRNGIGNTGLSDLMGAAGLTHGGFYKHFESKEQAVAEACSHGIREIAASLEDAIARDSGMPALHAAISAYLTTAHRDNPASGCPYAALGAELSRGSEPVRAVASEGLGQLVKLLAGPGSESGMEQRRDAMLALSAMIGAMTLARIVSDEKLSSDILQQMRTHLTAHLPSSKEAPSS